MSSEETLNFKGTQQVSQHQLQHQQQVHSEGNVSRGAMLSSMTASQFVRGQLSAGTHQSLYGNVLSNGKKPSQANPPEVMTSLGDIRPKVDVQNSIQINNSNITINANLSTRGSRNISNGSGLQTPKMIQRKIRLRPQTTASQILTDPDQFDSSMYKKTTGTTDEGYESKNNNNNNDPQTLNVNSNQSHQLLQQQLNGSNQNVGLKNVSFLASQFPNDMYSSRLPAVDAKLLGISRKDLSASSYTTSGVVTDPSRESRSAGRILPKNSALAIGKEFARKTNNSMSLHADEKEGKQGAIGYTSANHHNVSVAQMHEKDIANMSMYVPKFRDNEDFRVLADQQILAKMDREALIIRLAILESENKETKCHNIHLSDKFKELLDEYKRYKEYMDSMDRKSLYQKHVQRLSDLSKQLFDQRTVIDDRESKIRDLEESKRLVNEELTQLKDTLNRYNEMKAEELRAIEQNYNQITVEQAQRIEELLKESQRAIMFEKSYNEISDRIREETRKFSSAIDKSDERYSLLMQRWQETERECQTSKDRVRFLEHELKKALDSSIVTLAEKSQEFQERIQRQELERKQIISDKNSSIHKLQEEVSILTSQNLDLVLELNHLKETIAREENNRKTFEDQTTILEKQKTEQNNQVSDLSRQVGQMEQTVEEQKRRLQEQMKEVESLQMKLDGLQRRNEEMALLRDQMQEAHLAEMNKVFQQQHEITQQLNLKITEMKQHYEVEFDKIQTDCFERVKMSSTSANDAQRQCTILKVTYSQEIERKETEIEFLKNRIYQEKQRLKDQIESQYQDVIQELERRTEYLTKELDTQKWVVETSICEDMAVYNKKSKYWKKSREIRAQKLLIRTEDSESDEEYSPISKSFVSDRKGTSRNSPVYPAERLRIRFQVIAKNAKAFDQQQLKIDSLRQQIEFLTEKLSRRSHTRSQFQLLGSQHNGDAASSGAASDSNIGINAVNNQQTQQQRHQQVNMALQAFIQSHGIMSLVEEDDQKDMQEIISEKLMAKVSRLEEDLVKERMMNQELQEKFIQREYELQEDHKQKMKNITSQLDTLGQNKTQIAFQKDIIIEKLTTKVEEIKRQVEDMNILNTNHLSFTYKMRREFKDLEDKHIWMMNDLRTNMDQVIHALTSGGGASTISAAEFSLQERREIMKLVDIINEKEEQILSLKYQFDRKQNKIDDSEQSKQDLDQA